MMPTASDAEELLERILHGDGMTRLAAWGEAIEAGLGGMTVIDTCDGDRFGWTLQGFRRHLHFTDSLSAIEGRGYRIHTTRNVELGCLDDVDRGPVLGMAR